MQLWFWFNKIELNYAVFYLFIVIFIWISWFRHADNDFKLPFSWCCRPIVFRKSDLVRSVIEFFGQWVRQPNWRKTLGQCSVCIDIQRHVTQLGVTGGQLWAENSTDHVCCKHDVTWEWWRIGDVSASSWLVSAGTPADRNVWFTIPEGHVLRNGKAISELYVLRIRQRWHCV